MRKRKKSISILMIMTLIAMLATGCGKPAEEENGDNVLSDNIIITETGEVIQKYPQPTEAVVEKDSLESEPVAEQETGNEDAVLEGEQPLIQLEEPKLEQDPTAEEPETNSESELQLVFLGDSIFDNNRDGTGVPYLTAVACDANLYNLAIGGTSATLERGEPEEHELWDSQSLVGIVKVLEGDVTTDAFAGTRAKEILDDKEIDWSNTDYFIVEYGLNDFFRAAPMGNSENIYDVYAYSGALRYAVSNLQEVSIDATVILCGPHYAQFFSGNQFIGDGNTLNTGHGTLFDYKGTCQYVAKEQGAVFFDAYLDLGIDGYTAEDYLEDGVHLTEEGRKLYAEALANMILDIEEDKNN